MDIISLEILSSCGRVLALVDLVIERWTDWIKWKIILNEWSNWMNDQIEWKIKLNEWLNWMNDWIEWKSGLNHPFRMIELNERLNVVSVSMLRWSSCWEWRHCTSFFGLRRHCSMWPNIGRWGCSLEMDWRSDRFEWFYLELFIFVFILTLFNNFWYASIYEVHQCVSKYIDVFMNEWKNVDGNFNNLY